MHPNLGGDEWQHENPMPTARSGLAAASVPGRTYAIGGRDFAIPTMDTVESFDTATGEWRREPPMPTSRTQLAAVACSGRIWVIGGRDGFLPLDTVESLVPETGQWRQENSMPTARGWLAAAAVARGRCAAAPRR